jgi:TonB family protein
MFGKRMILIIATVGAILFALHPVLQADDYSRTFAFVDGNHIITAEVAGERTFILNVINLTDYVMVILPGQFIYRAASGRFYNGQVYETNHAGIRGERQRYSATFMLQGNSHAGLTIVGAFRELDLIEELSLRIGASRFFLEPLDSVTFEQLATRIGDLDLRSIDTDTMLNDAGIERKGKHKRADGSEEWDRDWAGLITKDGVNPPKIIENPDILPTSEAIRSRTYGTVRLTANINRNGEIHNVKVVKRLGAGLDERAVEGVSNSWIFLPATKTGEVVETAIPIEVEFPPPQNEKQP